MRLLSFVIASFLATLVTAIKIQGTIIPNAIISDVSTIDSSTTKVVLNGAQHVAHIKSNGEFTFPNVRPGSYLLEVQSIQHIFPKLRIDVGEDDQIQAAYTGLGINWNQIGYSVDYPLQIQAKGESDYFMERKGFNVMGMFKNPMFLMLGFSAVMMFFMPKMMEQMKNMDPEAAGEISQSKADAQKMLADMPGLSQMFAKQ